MIKTTLPTLEKELDGNRELLIKKGEITIGIDTSILAEERWEQNFPLNAKNETLFAYVERVQAAGLADKAHVLSNLKALYCFIESDNLPDWKSFLKLFDLADTDHITRLVEQIKRVFEIALSTATVSAKNS